MDQYVQYGLLDLNNDQSYSGSGGQNYTHDLPKHPGGGSDTRNFWGFCESQEFTMVGPEQHWEFVMKHEAKLAERFGLFSYGCCDPADNKLKHILNIHGIRRVSVSPWANVDACAPQIGRKAVSSGSPTRRFLSKPSTPWNPSSATCWRSRRIAAGDRPQGYGHLQQQPPELWQIHETLLQADPGNPGLI